MSEMDRYDFELPKELIAQYPRPNRADARLMLVDRKSGTIDHAHVRDLPELLHSGDALVLNNTRVVPARIVGFREGTRGRWQGLFLAADPQSGVWEVLAKTRGKTLPGERIVLQDRQGREAITIECIHKTDEGHWLVKPQAPGSAFELLERYGRVPIPPYIRDGQMVDSDLKDYQTVFANRPGSVAAPTAGLHFTEQLLRQLATAGVAITAITLHVGIGTFRPITATKLEEHRMHSERGELGKPTCDALVAARESGHRVVAVGSTSVRVLESAAIAGSGRLAPWQGETDLFIRPGHRFSGCDAIMTNFHLPRSSLLVMMSAFAGDELIRSAYQEAIREEYRFFSYGDAMLIT
ncbi:MAG: S-adenosylmethionine:tRNA ribosyltransferase-isomerase [Planctomycetota bacterium]|jgi:S-adenosylmethionine:tRNA ribosyltransferase-isomerase